jgi:hypothetical protein
MKLRRNQPALPCGGFADPINERLATEFVSGRQATPFAPHLPPGGSGPGSGPEKTPFAPNHPRAGWFKPVAAAPAGQIPNLSIGRVDRYQAGSNGYWRPLTARRRPDGLNCPGPKIFQLLKPRP